MARSAASHWKNYEENRWVEGSMDFYSWACHSCKICALCHAHLPVAGGGTTQMGFQEVDKLRRAFLWAGSDSVSGGKCLVKWSLVCFPWNLVVWEFMTYTDKARL